jgi:hypothetical protein
MYLTPEEELSHSKCRESKRTLWHISDQIITRFIQSLGTD